MGWSGVGLVVAGLGGVGWVGVGVEGPLGGWGLWGWGPTLGGTETGGRLQGTERAYEGAYTFGAYKRIGGQARSVKRITNI